MNVILTKRLAPNPGDAKYLGRSIRIKDKGEWERKKRDVMYEMVKQKFTKNEDLKQRLLDTGKRYD